jgi:putative hydrolase of the HAD superfamily
MKKALIFDLDNTIYPVSSIAENLFDQLFSLLDEHASEFDDEVMAAIKYEWTRRPYQLIADKFGFSAEFRQAGLDLLKNITYNLPMQPFEEYHELKTIPINKFLVTLGFSKLQWSKVKMLDIEGDFKEIHIVDPEISLRTKKDVFADIMKRHNYTAAEVLVIGDDPDSEIKAAIALGIDTFLYDPNDIHPAAIVTLKARDLRDVQSLLK